MTFTDSPRVARRWAAAVCVLGALLAAACGDDGAASVPPASTTASPTTSADDTATTTDDPTDGLGDSVAWPEPDWDVAEPAEAGVDEAVLAELATLAGDGGSDCLVVSRHGQIVGEWYWNGTDQSSEREAFSVTKSITSTLVGIAQEQGLLDIDQPASDFITEWAGTPSEAVTIRNLLTNDSGRFQTAESDYVQLATREADKSAYAIGLEQEHEIGTVWVYNNAAIQVLEEVLQRATGVEVHEYARVQLFEPLGMDSSIITDPAGNTLTFMGAQMSCRDMARFGLLYLRGGEWDGEQVVPAAWVTDATQPSTPLNVGYGYLWWLIGEGADDADAVATAPGQGAIPSSGPPAYAALGLGGQVIAIIPEHDLVVTRLGNPQAGSFSLLGVLQLLQQDLIVD